MWVSRVEAAAEASVATAGLPMDDGTRRPGLWTVLMSDGISDEELSAGTSKLEPAS